MHVCGARERGGGEVFSLCIQHGVCGEITESSVISRLGKIPQGNQH